MLFLVRVALPDVPGSLGRVATAIGEAGGDIEAIEIVERGVGGQAIDDVLLEITNGAMPDSVVSACNAIDGVEVLWISRYAAGGNLLLDLEVVEMLTARPETAPEQLVDLLPVTFRVSWAAWLRRSGSGVETVRATEAAPTMIGWTDLSGPARLEYGESDTVLAGTPFGDDGIVVMGREGGPAYLDSELARLQHLVGLARTIRGRAPAAG